MENSRGDDIDKLLEEFADKIREFRKLVFTREIDDTFKTKAEKKFQDILDEIDRLKSLPDKIPGNMRPRHPN